MNTEFETLTLIIPKNRKTDLLNLLKEVDFVQMDSLENRLKRYVENAPKDVPITEEEINQLIQETRSQ